MLLLSEPLQVGRAAEALLLVAGLHALLRISPRRAGAHLMRTVAKHSRHSAVAPELLSSVAVAIARAQRRVPRATCLSRAAAGWIMLRRRGVQCSVCVGARLDQAGSLEAHAWLECGRVDVLGTAPRSAEFVVFPGIA